MERSKNGLLENQNRRYFQLDWLFVKYWPVFLFIKTKNFPYFCYTFFCCCCLFLQLLLFFLLKRSKKSGLYNVACYLLWEVQLVFASDYLEVKVSWKIVCHSHFLFLRKNSSIFRILEKNLGGLVFCSPWGLKESDVTEQLNCCLVREEGMYVEQDESKNGTSPKQIMLSWCK